MTKTFLRKAAAAGRAGARAVEGGTPNAMAGNISNPRSRDAGNLVKFQRCCTRDGCGPGAGAGPGGFTLIELLIVISIIGLLSAFGISAMFGVVKNKYISTARSEMALIETGLERYKAAYGVYPPSNPNNFLVNPLYFELLGVTNANGYFTTLDGQTSVPTTQVLISFGVAGFLNCSKGGGEDLVPAKVFLPGLKANQLGSVTNPAGQPNPVAILVTSVGGPDQQYQPLGARNLNPWRYNTINPTNNPGSYELYVQLVISGKTNLICNWSKQAQINRSLP